MERYRLKNIIILILVFLNLFLLASLAAQKIAEHSTQRAAMEQLSSLFADDGMQLDPNIISREVPPASRAVSRDTALEKRIAEQLLDEAVTPVDQGGGISTYMAPAGTVYFRSIGIFDAVLDKPIQDGTGFCSAFCKTFSCSAPRFDLDDSGTGTAVAYQAKERLTVYNSSIVFTLKDGAVTAVSGTLISDTDTTLPQEQELLTSIAALIAFQHSRQETGSVVSAITGMELCWELQTASGSASLTPVWHISTDTADFYVNCVSGTVGRN